MAPEIEWETSKTMKKVTGSLLNLAKEAFIPLHVTR